ncbi:MAG: chromate resistance protein [Pseudomonadota bacterium]|nr:chromate resistance protein [Pseudomonadota bacterium]
MDDRTSPPAAAPPWLLLIHQLPPRPAYFRVKVWRRLQRLGAVAIKNAVYALPAGEPAREDFAWLAREIADGGGDASVCEARFVDGLSDEQVRGLFNAARDAEYDELAKEARVLGEGLPADPAAWEGKGSELRGRLGRLRKRLAEVGAIDFFGANGRETVEGLLSDLEARLRRATAADTGEEEAAVAELGELRDRTWVTRRGVHVDRIASAWLIRRFIDPGARFKFVPSTGYVPQPGELRFDMFEAEFTHEDERCTFEVLLAHAELGDPALRAIGEIVHDIDLKDDKFGREETAGIAHLIAGIAQAHEDDEQRLARGAAVLDDLYAYFRSRRG